MPSSPADLAKMREDIVKRNKQDEIDLIEWELQHTSPAKDGSLSILPLYRLTLYGDSYLSFEEVRDIYGRQGWAVTETVNFGFFVRWKFMPKYVKNAGNSDLVPNI